MCSSINKILTKKYSTCRMFKFIFALQVKQQKKTCTALSIGSSRKNVTSISNTEVAHASCSNPKYFNLNAKHTALIHAHHSLKH